MVGIKYIHGVRMNVIKTLQPQDHIRMQQISCDTSTRAHMAHIGSVVPFALEACGPRAYVTTEPIYAMWHSCMCHNYYKGVGIMTTAMHIDHVYSHAH